MWARLPHPCLRPARVIAPRVLEAESAGDIVMRGGLWRWDNGEVVRGCLGASWTGEMVMEDPGRVGGATQTDQSGGWSLVEGCMLDPENQGPNCTKYRPEAAITYTLRCRRRHYM
ncbi:hypothetical protein IMZ48_45655 [Candidatus Bathyarchaeota archaeon]|nr:hypothetical protein [Candidatus Bathyarchaeota archaeon]